MSRIRRHLTFANVASAVALFVALTGGTAIALGGANTVQSDDLGPGAQVKAPDIAANAVAAGPWRQVGTAGQPPFNQTDDCEWRNYDQVHSTAAFLRDRTGFVHLKGTVRALDEWSSGSCDFGPEATNQLIFVLPPGYRPPRREAMAVLTGASTGQAAADPAEIGTVGIDGPAISPLPAGAVSVHRDQIGGDRYFTLDGISFRCAPSGSNGCP